MTLHELLYWHWWVAALLLLILEAFAPGAVFLWMGVAAGVVGLLLLLMPKLALAAQLIVFGVLALITFFAWRRFKPQEDAEDQPTLNRRGESYVGRHFTLSEAIVNGVGELRVDDTQWRVVGPDLPSGSAVRVTGTEGATLKVEALR